MLLPFATSRLCNGILFRNFITKKSRFCAVFSQSVRVVILVKSTIMRNVREKIGLGGTFQTLVDYSFSAAEVNSTTHGDRTMETVGECVVSLILV